MPLTADPRSVHDATRFTSTTPHSASSPQTASRFSPRATQQTVDPSITSKRPPTGSAAAAAGGGVIETPEQRVARLRAAHLAAKNASISRFDAIIDSSRRLFDTAHKVTVMGLVGFSVVATLMTIYTVGDMMVYNNRRKNEFITIQRQAEQDSLEAARLAYMRGDATEDQIELVEYVNAREAQYGESSGGIFKMPSILSSPQKLENPERTTGDAGAEGQTPSTTPKPGGLWRWMFGEKDEVQREGEVVKEKVSRPIEEKYAMIRQRAMEAFDKERETQANGGPLDRVGGNAVRPEEQKREKKGWLW